MKFALDTNCFIDALNPGAPAHEPIRRIIAADTNGRAEIHVSLHTLHELEQGPDKALDLARKYLVLPHWPIGIIEELVGAIEQMTGTLRYE